MPASTGLIIVGLGMMAASVASSLLASAAPALFAIAFAAGGLAAWVRHG